jgi:hypothetical protein
MLAGATSEGRSTKLTLREAERIVIQRSKRYCGLLTSGLCASSASAFEALAELRQAVSQLEEVEASARHAAQRHTEGGEW